MASPLSAGSVLTSLQPGFQPGRDIDIVVVTCTPHPQVEVAEDQPRRERSRTPVRGQQQPTWQQQHHRRTLRGMHPRSDRVVVIGTHEEIQRVLQYLRMRYLQILIQRCTHTMWLGQEGAVEVRELD